jgi:hypothetical protein
MNDVQFANELRDTLAKRVLLPYASEQGGNAHRNQLEKWQTATRGHLGCVQGLESRGLAQNSSLASDVNVTPAGQRVAQRIRVMRSGLWRIDDVQHAILT